MAPSALKPSRYVSSTSVGADFARALGELVMAAAPYVDVFESRAEIDVRHLSDDALRWQREKASASSFVLLVLTPDSIDRPWVTWEAGVIAASVEPSRFVP